MSSDCDLYHALSFKKLTAEPIISVSLHLLLFAFGAWYKTVTFLIQYLWNHLVNALEFSVFFYRLCKTESGSVQCWVESLDGREEKSDAKVRVIDYSAPRLEKSTDVCKVIPDMRSIFGGTEWAFL